MIQISHVEKYYVKEKAVISDISLNFGDVGLNMIVGKSGCGKTTLLNMIGTMDQDYIGSIVYNGVELTTLSYDKICEFRNYELSYIFQINSLFEDLTVRQNIEMALNLQGKTTNIDEILDKVGLSGFENRKIKYLSGGEKQRVSIARAIAKDCKVILADEPTSALDTKNSHRIFELLKEISKDKLVIVVTHDVKKARLYADRIIRLVDGRVAEDETINLVRGSTVVKKRNKSSKKTLTPIFWSQFRKSLLINLFISIVISIGIIITNIAYEDSKIIAEYDIIEGDSLFNENRVLTTHYKNDINFYNIVPRKDAIDKYTYFKEYKSALGGLLSDDVLLLKSYLKDYNQHLNNERGNIIIEGVSQIYRYGEEINGIRYYWYEPQISNYTYYLYDFNNDYNLLAGREPIISNEIMITDTIAKEYLLRKDLDASDLSVMLDQELTIYDIYHTVPSKYAANNNYYYSEKKAFKVVGILNTNQFGFFDYDTLTYRYVLNKGFTKQNTAVDEPYLNGRTTYPLGYIVTMKDLDAYKIKTHFYDEYNIESIRYDDIIIKNSNISTFHGTYDYKTNITVEDNLHIDKYNREILFSTQNENLNENEIIITDDFIRFANPNVLFSTHDLIYEIYDGNLVWRNFGELERYTIRTKGQLLKDLDLKERYGEKINFSIINNRLRYERVNISTHDSIAREFMKQFPKVLENNFYNINEYFHPDFDIVWSSSNEKVFSNTGIFTMPEQQEVITISFAVSDENETRQYQTSMLAPGSNENQVETFSTVREKFIKQFPIEVTADLLIIDEFNGYSVSWSSSNEDIINNHGKVNQADNDEIVDITFAITYNGVTNEYSHKVFVPRMISSSDLWRDTGKNIGDILKNIDLNDNISKMLEPKIRDFYKSNYQNKEITLTFHGDNNTITKTFTIVGVAKGSSDFPGKPGYFYLSEVDLHEIKNIDVGYTSALTIELNGVDPDKRIEIINDLYEMGYLLSPVNTLSGAYLEFVPGQGNTEVIGSDGFGDWVNLSVYHLFSPFYNTKGMNEVNSVLDIVARIYLFVLIMSIIISVGLTYLKERRQRLDIMKLTQLGVKAKSITLMNMIYYIINSMIMIVLSIIGTIILINIINNIFILQIVGNDGIGLIHRIRIMYNDKSTVFSIAISVIIFILSALSTSIFTKIGRR